MPKEKTLPPKLLEVLKKIDMTQEQATWDVHGTPVLLHKACEKMAAEYNIVFDAPTMIESDASSKQAVMCVTGHMGDNTEWSIGEATPYNNKNNYPYAMAEKRAKDRVILKLVGLHGHVYSEAEADEFSEEKPKPLMNLDTEARVDAAITFYENCNQSRFADNEKRYKNLLNNADINEQQYEAVVEAHDKRKVELMI
jgi:hypothetical protein